MIEATPPIVIIAILITVVIVIVAVFHVLFGGME